MLVCVGEQRAGGGAQDFASISLGSSVVCFRIAQIPLGIVTDTFSPVLDSEPLTVQLGLTYLRGLA